MRCTKVAHDSNAAKILKGSKIFRFNLLVHNQKKKNVTSCNIVYIHKKISSPNHLQTYASIKEKFFIPLTLSLCAVQAIHASQSMSHFSTCVMTGIKYPAYATPPLYCAHVSVTILCPCLHHPYPPRPPL